MTWAEECSAEVNIVRHVVLVGDDIQSCSFFAKRAAFEPEVYLFWYFELKKRIVLN